MNNENFVTDILKQLINKVLNLETDLTFLRVKNSLSITAMAREFGTIKLQSHRQAGHTSAIIELATKNSLVIVPTQLHPLFRKKSDYMIISTITHVDSIIGINNVDMIFVDQASSISINYIKELYDASFLSKCFKNSKIPILIFLE